MTGIANEYAQALYSLAADEGLSERILGELGVLAGAIRTEPGFLRLLAAPNLTKEERRGIIDRCFSGRVHTYVLSFLKLLTDKGCIRQFPACCDAYRALYNEGNGILTVKAVTAVPLTAAQEERLRGKLAGLTGKKIELLTRVEPDCLGGVRLDYDGKRVDDTVRHRLDTVRSLLESTTL